MSQVSIYLKYKNLLQQLCDEDYSYTYSEKKLFSDLLRISAFEEKSHLFHSILGSNDSFSLLLKQIQDEIRSIRKNIDDLSEWGFFHVVDDQLVPLKDKISRLQDLEKEIQDFLQNPIVFTGHMNKDALIKKCLDVLSFNDSTFFGEKLSYADSFGIHLNHSLISFIFSLLEDNSLMAELAEGVNIIEKGREHLQKLNLSQDALSYQTDFYHNAHDIIRMNQIRTRLEEIEKLEKSYQEGEISSFNSSKIRSFFKRKQPSDSVDLMNALLCEKKELESELKQIQSIIQQTRFAPFLLGDDISSERGSISYFLNHVLSIEDANNYFDYLKRAVSFHYKNLKELDYQKTCFKGKASHQTMELLTHDFDSVSTIHHACRRVHSNNLSYGVALFLLYFLSVMEQVDLSSFQFQSGQYEKTIQYYFEFIQKRYDSFYQEYQSVLYGDQKVYQKSGETIF